MAEQTQKFEIQKIFIKDVSFESPNAPGIFRKEWKPETDIHLATENKKMSDTLFEVTLNVTVTTKHDDKTAFLVELKQAGIFTIEGFEETQLKQLLGSYCPHSLFPFAREAVSDLISKGGFPPLLLAPVNFDALYAQQLQRAEAEKAGSETSTKH